MRRLSFNNNFVLSWTFVCNRNQCNLRFCFWANGKYSFKSKLTTDRAAFIFRVFQFLILITRDVALLPCVVARHACGGVDTRARHTCVNHPWVPEILVTSFVLAHCTEIDSPGEHHIRIVFFSGRDIFHTLRYRTNMNWRRQFSREMGGGREIAIRWSSTNWDFSAKRLWWFDRNVTVPHSGHVVTSTLKQITWHAAYFTWIFSQLCLHTGVFRRTDLQVVESCALLISVNSI